MSAVPDGHDPREFALQLAVVAERLDERSTRAVERVEAVAAAFVAEVERMREATVNELSRAAAAQQASERARLRMSRIVSRSLAAAALFATAATIFTVGSARRELASICRDRALLDAINNADVTSCDGRLCARIDGQTLDGDADGYRRIALRKTP